MNEQTTDTADPFYVDKPAHVPDEAVVDVDYHKFAGHKDPRFASIGDNQLAWKQLQDSDGPPLRWTPRNGGHWIATKGHVIAEVLEDPARFSSKYIALPKEVGELYDFVPLTLDPPEHKPYRSVLNPLMSHKILRHKEGAVREMAVDLIDGFKDKGACDYVRDFANILPVSTFHDLVGLPPEERETLRQMAGSGDQTSPESTAAMLQQIEDYLSPHLKKRRSDPGTDLFSGLLHSNVGDRPITDEEAMHMCKQLFVAGFHTTASTLTFVTHHMAKFPELRENLKSDPKRIRHKVEELLRRFAMVGIPRTATVDCTLGGMPVKAGEPVFLPLVLYNLDDDIFPNPLEIDFSRRGTLQAGFGRGVHRCPGSVLGVVEIAVSLEEWLARIPEFEIDGTKEIITNAGGVAALQSLPLTWTV